MRVSRADDPADDGRNSALRRFPGQGGLIEQLLRQSESFSGLCADLAAAERALIAAEEMPIGVRDERRHEFAALVEGLVQEVEDALEAAKVVSIGNARRHPGAPPRGRG
jgi:hypothetical protein